MALHTFFYVALGNNNNLYFMTLFLLCCELAYRSMVTPMRKLPQRIQYLLWKLLVTTTNVEQVWNFAYLWRNFSLIAVFPISHFNSRSTKKMMIHPQNNSKIHFWNSLQYPKATIRQWRYEKAWANILTSWKVNKENADKDFPSVRNSRNMKRNKKKSLHAEQRTNERVREEKKN